MPLEQFRTRSKRPKIHELELGLLWIIGGLLVFQPWAIGGMPLWAQCVSLGWSGIAFILALVPRNYTEAQTGAGRYRLVTWPRLLRFPLFWLGLLFLLLIMTQALNPAWAYQSDGKSWWMRANPHVSWLPSGVRVPISGPAGAPAGGPWRYLMIYTSAWLTVCAIWVGITRRRSLQRLMIALVANGVALALLGFAQRFTHAKKIFWSYTPPPGAAIFASFIYKNHAGAYLDLAIIVTCALGVWYYVRGGHRLEKSNPASMFVFLATVVTIAVIVSFARGATLTILAFLLVTTIGFVVHQFRFAPEVSRKPVVTIVLVVIFGFFLKTGLEAVNIGEAWDRMKNGFENGGDYSLRTRMASTDASMEMLREHWALGIGSGSFQFLFPMYQPRYEILRTIPGTNRRPFWQHAHNDWMEIPNELGVSGILIIVASLGWLGLTLIRNSVWTNPFGATLLTGLFALMFYSYWDFPFFCPAVLITWVSLWPVCVQWVQFEEQH